MRNVKVNYSAQMKTCRKCNQSKPLSAFPPNERYAGGYGTWCKECHRLANREWYLSNAESNKARADAWRRDNPDAIAAINKRHKDANKVRLAQSHAEWASANKDKRRATSAKRKAARLRATPAWADMRAIGEVYAEAIELEAFGIRFPQTVDDCIDFANHFSIDNFDSQENEIIDKLQSMHPFAAIIAPHFFIINAILFYNNFDAQKRIEGMKTFANESLCDLKKARATH